MYGYKIEPKEWNIQKCNYCNKEFTSFVSLGLHKQKCKKKPSDNQKTLGEF